MTPLETEIRTRHQGGDFRGAVAVAIQGYGPEVFGFLLAMIHDRELASDAFSDFCEDVCRGMADFRWGCSFRTWAYVIARNVAYMAGRSRRATTSLENHPELLELEERVRTETLSHFKAERVERLQQLRRQLPPDDQMLLILRVDKRLEWAEIARVMSGPSSDEGPDAPTDAQRSATWRKRFERTKQRLRRLAEKEGLLEREEK